MIERHGLSLDEKTAWLAARTSQCPTGRGVIVIPRRGTDV